MNRGLWSVSADECFLPASASLSPLAPVAMSGGYVGDVNEMKSKCVGADDDIDRKRI